MADGDLFYTINIQNIVTVKNFVAMFCRKRIYMFAFVIIYINIYINTNFNMRLHHNYVYLCNKNI